MEVQSLCFREVFKRLWNEDMFKKNVVKRLGMKGSKSSGWKTGKNNCGLKDLFVLGMKKCSNTLLKDLG